MYSTHQVAPPRAAASTAARDVEPGQVPRSPALRSDRAGQLGDLVTGEVAPLLGVAQLVGEHSLGPSGTPRHDTGLRAAADPHRNAPAGILERLHAHPRRSRIGLREKGEQQVEPLVHLLTTRALRVPQRVDARTAVA